MQSVGLFAQLKRRDISRATAIYAAAVWALAQGIAQLGAFVGVPDWAARWFIVPGIRTSRAKRSTTRHSRRDINPVGTHWRAAPVRRSTRAEGPSHRDTNGFRAGHQHG